ncbi:hypothetical protein KJ951_01195 [Patescibacteria group bacterium]|nr:hypothetical protein [Patescibacteria group bacterium]MBU1702996.1 hypothetical protein [Patescibacteria group bacterium]MBU1953689.1 hypothetical protein [Patescibacteria group bacterium]
MTPESDSKKVDLHPHLSVTVEEADRLAAYLNKHYPQLPLQDQLAQFSEDMVNYNHERPNPYQKIQSNITIGPQVVNSKIRKAQESEIMHTLEHGHNVYIRGYWRAGKSTMVQSIKENLPETTINIGNIFGKTEAEVKKELAYEIAQTISGAENSDEDELEQEILRAQDPVDYYNEYLKRKRSMGVICIDEVIGIVDKPEVLAYIGSLDQRGRYSNLRMVFVLHRTEKYEEELMKHFTAGVPFNIGSVPERDTDTLREHYNPDQLIKFTPEAKKSLLHYSGTSPFAFNILIYWLCEQMGNDFNEYHYKDDKTPALGKLKLTITEDDVKAAVKACYNGTGNVGLYGNNQRILNTGLNAHEQEVIYSLSLGPISFHEKDEFSPEKQQALYSLIKYGLVVADPENELYKINGEILRTIVENAAMREIYEGDDPGKNSFRKRVMAIIDAAR